MVELCERSGGWNPAWEKKGESMQTKKSDYLKRAKELTGITWGSDGALVRLAEETGVQWEPEEPELPERINGGLVDGIPALSREYRGGPLFDPETWKLVYQEAARRYNAYPELEALAQELADELRQVNEGRFGTRVWSDLLARARSLGLLREAA